MPKTKKAARVRSPRKPRGETAKVTIANQDKQIQMLIRRVEDLSEEREVLRIELGETQVEVKELRERNGQIENVHVRLKGWQDCAREMLPSRT